MKIFTLLFLLLFSCVQLAFAELTQEQIDSENCQRLLTVLTPYINEGGDPNRDPNEHIYQAEGRDTHVLWGAGSPLGDAVSANCLEVAQLLLENGADPNQFSRDQTPLCINYYNMLSTRNIEDPTLKDQSLIPMRAIRDLLLSNGAVSDNTPQVRREFIRKFRAYLSSTNGHFIFIFCETNQITIDDQGVAQQYDIPVESGVPFSSYSLRPVLSSVLEIQKDIENVNVAIIGPAEIVFPVKVLYKQHNIPSTIFQIPANIPCDAKTLTSLFINHPDAYFDEMLELMNELCPGPQMNPFSGLEDKYLAL